MVALAVSMPSHLNTCMKIKDLLNKPTLSVGELSKKYKVAPSAVKTELSKGMQVELEHSSDPQVAREIALAHLGEDLYYYDKLSKAEQELCEDTTRTSKSGAPGTLKAKISRLYGGAVTCAKTERLKRRENATAHDKAQANWFQNKHCGGASRVDEIFAEPAREMPWRQLGSGEHLWYETNFRFMGKNVVVEVSPDVRQVSAKYIFRSTDTDLPTTHQGWVLVFRVDGTTDVTGEFGNQAVKLLTQVVSVVRGFLESHDWDYVIFVGEEGSRNKLYQALAQRLAQQAGAKVLQHRSDFAIYKPQIAEQGGVGLVVPGVNMPAGMHPDEIRRQAAKWGFKVSKHGVPPVARTDGKY